MRIVITGGNGYIGKNLTHYLKDSKNEVIVVVRKLDSSKAIKADNIKYVELDILNNNIEDIFSYLSKPDLLIHLAWQDGFNHGAMSHIHNISKHVGFIEEMLSSGLKNVSVIGTMHEIGYYVGEINENTATNPQNYYGVAKNFLRKTVELLCKQHGASYKWLRVYYIYGDDKNNNSIFTKLLQAEERGDEYFYLNSGELLYDFIDVKELSKQIAEASIQNDISGIINCCTGEPISLKTMVEKFKKDNDLSIKFEYNKFPIRPYDARAIWGSNELIKKIIKRNAK